MIQGAAGIASGGWLPGYASGRLDASAGTGARSSSSDQAASRGSGSSSADGAKALSAEEQRQIRELAKTDREVRAHEQAHISVGGNLIRGGPTYSFKTGPDNKLYAVSGEVSIDASPARTPEETVPKADRIRAAALAPADPSAQDYRVAATASQMKIEAQLELARERADEATTSSSARSTAVTRTYGAIASNDTGGAGNGGGKSALGSRLDLFA